MFELFLDVIGMLTVKTATMALQALRGNPSVLEIGVEAAATVAAMRQASEAQLATVVGTAASTTRRMLPPGESPRPNTAKAAAVSYLDLLANRSATIYERLREDVVAQADDSTLLVLFHSFGASEGG